MKVIYLDNAQKPGESDSDYALRVAKEGRDVRLHVLTPVQEYVAAFGIEAIAIKDVPHGRAFKVVPDDFLDAYEGTPPDDWTIAPAELSDGVGGESNSFEGKK